MEEDKCIGHLNGWSDEDVSVAIFAIHHFGSAQHPAAERKTLPHFKVDYLLKCLCKVCDSEYIADKGEKAARNLIFKLENPPMSKEEYINDYDGIVCPVCRQSTNNLSTDAVEQGDHSLFQTTYCKNCGASWTDEYTLVNFIMDS